MAWGQKKVENNAHLDGEFGNVEMSVVLSKERQQQQQQQQHQQQQQPKCFKSCIHPRHHMIFCPLVLLFLLLVWVFNFYFILFIYFILFNSFL